MNKAYIILLVLILLGFETRRSYISSFEKFFKLELPYFSKNSNIEVRCLSMIDAFSYSIEEKEFIKIRSQLLKNNFNDFEPYEIYLAVPSEYGYKNNLDFIVSHGRIERYSYAIYYSNIDKVILFLILRN